MLLVDTFFRYTSSVSIRNKPEYVAVTTRGRGGSQFLDTLTQHGGGTIGNQNGFGPKNILSFLTKD